MCSFKHVGVQFIIDSPLSSTGNPKRASVEHAIRQVLNNLMDGDVSLGLGRLLALQSQGAFRRWRSFTIHGDRYAF